MPILSNTLIYLFGFAGTGKYTIAQEIARMSDAVVVDNHLINHPVFAILRPDGVRPLPMSVWGHTWKIRQAVFDVMRTLAPPETSFVLTNELLEEHPTDPRLFAETQELAEARGARFLPVRLLCNKEELCRRVTTPQRAARYKHTDAAGTAAKFDRTEVLKPSHPHLMELDVTDMLPRVAATHILERAKE